MKLKNISESIIFLLPCIFFLLLTLCGLRVSALTISEIERELRVPEISEDRFTQLFHEYAHGNRPDVKVRIIAPLRLKIKYPDAPECTINLHNAWAECRDNPSRRIDCCSCLLKVIEESHARARDSLVDVVPLIRNMEKFDPSISKVPIAQQIASEPLVADISIVYATDMNHSVKYLTPTFLKQHHIDYPHLRATAIANLMHRQHAADIICGTKVKMQMLHTDGTYESSWLLVDKFWNDQSKLIKGDIVAAVPARDVLIFTSSVDIEALRAMRKTTDKLFAQGVYQISKRFLVWRQNKWEPFEQ